MTDDGVTRVQLQRGEREVTDVLVTEEPMEIRVDGRPLAVLMRTPGPTPEEDLDLATGFLATEGVIDGLDDLSGLSTCIDPNRPNGANIVLVNLAGGAKADPDRFERAQRTLYATSSCGLCGKASIDRVFLNAPPLDAQMVVPTSLLSTLPARLRAVQPRFALTGGLHGAALLTADGSLLTAAEDVGRHNAVDKVIGHRIRADAYPLENTILVVSSRAGFEILQKAVMARIGAVVAVGAASSLAHELALAANVALYSFVRGETFNAHRATSIK